MKLTALNCPRCGAQTVRVDEEIEMRCANCGALFLINDQNLCEVVPDDGYAPSEPEEQEDEPEKPDESDNKQRPRRLWLWVPGWLLLPALPLTVLMLRQKGNRLLRYWIIAGAWLLTVTLPFLLLPTKEQPPVELVPTKEQRPVEFVPTKDLPQSETVRALDGPRTMSVKVSQQRLDSNSVGAEWSLALAINGAAVQSAYELRAGDTLTLYAKMTESDMNPDVGEAYTVYTVTEEDLANGFSVPLSVYITENGGRYVGQTAHFIVTFRFTAV